MQQKPHWRTLYQYIYDHTTAPQYRLAHQMCRSMLSSSPLALLRLCLICLRHRQTIYYHQNLHGLRGCIRGFFYPFIFAYGNVQYDLE